jgi:hypothetical protein
VKYLLRARLKWIRVKRSFSVSSSSKNACAVEASYHSRRCSKDIEAARDFYEAQEACVGGYCVDSLLADIESLGLFSGIHQLHFEFHRMLASRFPFGIYYREHEDETQVFAVLDLRRDPNWIRKELGKREV